MRCSFGAGRPERASREMRVMGVQADLIRLACIALGL